MKVHFISIGGTAMHNLAIALHKKGYTITGSDDEIFEPSKSRLKKYNLLPEKIGWDTSKIKTELDAIILGMHAHEDNPELLKAKELNLKIFSYPEYLYEQTKNKTRVVIGGSHGKTTITSIIMFVLKYNNIKFDYMVGSQIKGFETMVSLSNDAKIAVFEGDEYLSSPIDRRPKFHLYKPNIALLSGIAWDHINVFPTFENYVEQFEIFIKTIEKNGTLIYFNDDPVLKKIVKNNNNEITKIPYSTHKYIIENNISKLITDSEKESIQLFGEHNMQNVNGARLICNELGISNKNFYKAVSEFSGAAKRLQLITKNENTNIYLDFAHSPSKLKATTSATKQQYPERELVACIELHTYSSLNESFLPHYKDTMNKADLAIIYFNPKAIELKRLKQLDKEQVKKAFNHNNSKILTDINELVTFLKNINFKNKNLLLMSSGNFSGINIAELATNLTK
ncbi:MAG: peptidoglycan synthetase [Bacteroidetes bacterium]|nr:MAG: peptidoglycan synthetase [Bacteroidota bacterium]